MSTVVSRASAFRKLFQGNPSAHYTWKPGEYSAIGRGISDADIERHLSGVEPGVLSIPVLASGMCHFAAGDCDRHGADDVSIDHAEVARKITEFGLPLVITRSKSPKGAHIWLFFKDKDGFPCATARQLIQKYMKVLDITGEIEVFPKQEVLKMDEETGKLKPGSGINLPFFGQNRIGFGRDGEELAVADFVVLAHQRQAFGKILKDRHLADTPEEEGPKQFSNKPLPVEAIRKIHENFLKDLAASNAQGHWNDTLNTTAFWAGRAFAGHALEGDQETIIEAIRKAASAIDGWNEKRMNDTIESGWESGITQPLQILDPKAAHADALARIKAWLGDPAAPNPDAEDMYADLGLLSNEEYEPLRTPLKVRLKVRVSSVDQSRDARKPGTRTTVEPGTMTVDEIKIEVDSRLDGKPDEGDRKFVENMIWDYLRTHAKVFCCDGQGYFLMNDGDGIPIDVSPDSQEFNRLLIAFGIHSGSPTRQRIGEFVETKCFHEGIQTHTRLGFYYDTKTFSQYSASRRGWLIRTTRYGFDELPNGTDDVLFVYPPNWTPLITKPLAEIGGVIEGDNDFPKSDMCVHALFTDGHLTRYLFEGATFEVRSMEEAQVRILILSYIIFLMVPGVVSERAMLQSLGQSSSGKSLFLEIIGFILVGPRFSLRGLPSEIKEFENQLINEFLLGFDNVSKIPLELRDRFCQAVTGVEIVRRVLFTDKREMREMSKATICLSAIDPPLPEEEHANRTITIRFSERPEGTFLAKEEIFKVISENRDDIILNLIRRITLVLEALDAQRKLKYVPRVSVRLASIATFIMRIARQEGWETKAVVNAGAKIDRVTP